MWDTSNTSAEIEESDVDTAILPVGAIEQHGPHLPVSVDWKQADALGRGVAERLNAFLLPALPFGNSEAHAGFRGSIQGYANVPDWMQEELRSLALRMRLTD